MSRRSISNSSQNLDIVSDVTRAASAIKTLRATRRHTVNERRPRAISLSDVKRYYVAPKRAPRSAVRTSRAPPTHPMPCQHRLRPRLSSSPATTEAATIRFIPVVVQRSAVGAVDRRTADIFTRVINLQLPQHRIVRVGLSAIAERLPVVRTRAPFRSTCDRRRTDRWQRSAARPCPTERMEG